MISNGENLTRLRAQRTTKSSPAPPNRFEKPALQKNTVSDCVILAFNLTSKRPVDPAVSEDSSESVYGLWPVQCCRLSTKCIVQFVVTDSDKPGDRVSVQLPGSKKTVSVLIPEGAHAGESFQVVFG